MDTAIKTDVIIIGAGPTGLSLACQFVRYGINFIIIEKNEGVTPFSKAIGVQTRTLEIYEQMNLAEYAVSQGFAIEKMRLTEGGKVRGEVNLTSAARGMSAYPYVLALEQSKNEQLLYDFLRSHGKEVLWETELETLLQTESGVIAQIKDSQGTSRSLEAKYLVGCDGAHSPVRHAVGLAFEGSTFERLFYVADVEIDWELSHDAMQIFLTRNGVLAIFPMKGEKHYRIVGVFPEGTDREESDFVFADIQQRVQDETEIAINIPHVIWFSVYKVHTRHVEKFSEGRCFLAGDSAHIHTPAGGQGMNTGIQDAYNLAWKLALVLNENANTHILDTYNQERLANAKHLLKTTDRMFNLMAGGDWLLNAIRTTIFPPLAHVIMGMDIVKKQFVPMITQISINYRDSELSEHDGDASFSVKAGDRLPYFLVDGSSVYDRLREPKFHLLTFSDGESNYRALTSEIEGAFASQVDSLVVPLNPRVVEAFGSDKPFHVLLRPDNYIGFLSLEHPLERLRSYLGRICFAPVS